MEGFDILGYNLPFFLIIALFFSYIAWSKLFNQGKLAIKKSDSILDIFWIFVLFIYSVSIFSWSLWFPQMFFNGEVNWNLIFDNIKSTIVLFSFIAIIVFLLFRNKKLVDNTHKNFFLIILILHLLTLSIFTAWALRYLSLAIFSIALILFYFSYQCINIITHCYLNNDIDNKKLLNKEEMLITIISFVIFTVIAISLICLKVPSINYDDSKLLEYKVFDAESIDREFFLKTEIPVTIKNPILKGNLINLIKIDLNKYDLDTKYKEEFILILNLTNGKEVRVYPLKKDYGLDSLLKNDLKSIEYNDNNKILNIKYNQFHEKIIRSLKIIGLQHINVSNEEYSYSSKQLSNVDTCKENICHAEIDIFNNLTLPIYQEDDIVFNLRYLNVNGNCEFTNAVANYWPYQGYRFIDPECSGTSSCDIEIINDTTSEHLFRLNLYVTDNTLIRQSRSDIKVPLKIHADFEITCKDDII